MMECEIITDHREFIRRTEPLFQALERFCGLRAEERHVIFYKRTSQKALLDQFQRLSHNTDKQPHENLGLSRRPRPNRSPEQPVVGFRILKICRAETLREKRGLGSEMTDFPLQRRPVCPITAGKIDSFRNAGKRWGETPVAGWGAWIRTREWRNQKPLLRPSNTATNPFRTLGKLTAPISD
jgi:hypothetical protein